MSVAVAGGQDSPGVAGWVTDSKASPCLARDSEVSVRHKPWTEHKVSLYDKKLIALNRQSRKLSVKTLGSIA